MLYKSILTPWFFSIAVIDWFIVVKLIKPRISILIKPSGSRYSIEYWVHNKLSALFCIGTISVKFTEERTTPAACNPVCLGKFNNFIAILNNSGYSFWNCCKAFAVFVSWYNSSKLSVKIEQIESIITRFIDNILPTSLITIFAFILWKIMMWATLFFEYFSNKYSTTSFLLSSIKSTSISGIVDLCGFKNLSKIKLFLIGSTVVIPNKNATKLPAALPLPGPTIIPLFFA